LVSVDLWARQFPEFDRYQHSAYDVMVMTHDLEITKWAIEIARERMSYTCEKLIFGGIVEFDNSDKLWKELYHDELRHLIVLLIEAYHRGRQQFMRDIVRGAKVFK
jgi:hypothetical protein